MMHRLAVFALVLALGISPVAAQTLGGPVSGGGGGSGPPSGAAGGILGGTYPNPTIAAISTLSPATSGTLNNYVIGGSTPLAGTFTALTATGAVALSPANVNVVLSPTGTGVVTINPATAGTMNRVAIGGTTPLAGTFTAAIANSFVPNLSTIPTNGLYLAAANNPAIAANSTKIFDCLSTGCTDTGTLTLTVSGNNNNILFGANSAAGYGILSLTGATTSAGNIGLSGGATADASLYVQAKTGGSVIQQINGSAVISASATAVTSTVAVVTNSTDASSSTGGALQVVGGASVAKRFWIPAITASAGLQTAVLCQSSGGEMIADSVACLASSARFKIIYGPMPYGALDKIAALPIERWSYKAEGIFKEGDWTRERIGAIAEDVASLDPRLVGYDGEGKPRSISTEQLLALTIKAVQELKTANDNLRAEVHRLETRIR